MDTPKGTPYQNITDREEIHDAYLKDDHSLMCLFFRADQKPNLYVFDVIQKVRGTDDVK